MNAYQVVVECFRQDEFVDLLYWSKTAIPEEILLLFFKEEALKKYITDRYVHDPDAYEQSMKEIIADYRRRKR